MRSKLLQKIVLLFAVCIFVLAYFHITNPIQSSHITTIPIKPISPNDHIRGNSDATVTIIEYSDFECPECQYFQPTIKQILSAYQKDIRWIVRPYPLPQHSNAEKEAEAAECAASLTGNSAYWKFSDALFAQEVVTNDGTGFVLAKLPKLAQQIGIDTKKFTTCLHSGKFYNKVQQSIADATKGGITQLPATVIIDKRGNMQLITGSQPFEVYNSLMKEAINH